MPRTHNCHKSLILLFVLLVFTHSQPGAGQAGRNLPRQPPNRDENMHQNPSNRKARDDRPPQRLQKQQRVPKQERVKVQREQTQKHTNTENKKATKQKNLASKSEQFPPQPISSGAHLQEQKYRQQQDDKLYLEEEKHRRGDQKRQSLIKLLILIVLGLLTIVIILLVKIYFKRNKSLPIQNHTTENRTANNQPQSYIFQTFQDNESHIQKIIIKQKQTKIEIIKDLFLKKDLPAPQQDEIKIGTPTFGESTHSNQI